MIVSLSTEKQVSDFKRVVRNKNPHFMEVFVCCVGWGIAWAQNGVNDVTTKLCRRMC